MGVICRWYLDW